MGSNLGIIGGARGGRHGGERQMRGRTRENQAEKLRGHYIWLNYNMYLGIVGREVVREDESRGGESQSILVDQGE